MPIPHPKSGIELVVPPFVAIDASAARGGDTPPVQLQGKVRLRLAEPTTFKHIGIDLRGALTVMPISTGRTWRADSRTVHMSTKLLLDSKTVLSAGLHEFDFAMIVPPDAPCTLPDIGGMARVVYTLRARALRARSLFPALAAERVVTIVRTYARESVEFQNVYEAENVWRGKAIYSVALPHRAWAAGDTLMALVKLVPLSKDATPSLLRMSLREDVRIVTSNGPRAFTRHVATAAHPVIFPPSPSTSTSPAATPGVQMSAPSDPGPFALHIPAKTIPTYRSSHISVKHHLDLLVQFAAPGTPRAFECHTVSLAVRVLAHTLLSSARIATLENRRALFGPLPALMSIPRADGEGEEEQELPSYAAHVQDSIPVPGFDEVELDPDETSASSSRRSMDTVRSVESVALDPRRLSRVPDYGAAVSSIIVPLWSVRGLPSYAEASASASARS
ncbi:hypothetical protein AURDEDRAFT_114483 [Auricularia subglabra TFB-10046 SS5]|nr:hypothetical protein AURDEDRAFT_114483 [Auricularia subglabra TFB-10046 SS5]